MMRRLTLAFALLAAIATPAAAADTAKASFVNAAGEANGQAKLTGTPGGVLIEVEVTGLPPSQWVGFHVHQTGSCDHSTKHESAGGHFNPGGAEHGFLADRGQHAGDMPNQWVGSDGTLRAQVLNAEVDLDGSDTAIRGKALMVHRGADDYASQPSGKAGARQACGLIE
jgi:Cu-Zn family superoxide dismutase